MGDAGSVIMPEKMHRDQIYEGYKNHFDAHRDDSQLVLLELVRKNHPSYHVTCVTPTKCDLFGYAAAGHAAATIDSEGPLASMRNYNEPGPRLEKKPGILKDQIHFGRWQYTWKHSEYILYDMQWLDIHGRPTKLIYVLAPRSQGVESQGHFSTTDELLLAVGAWSTELHEEIYVFDEGHWSKSNALWKSVQGCSWDDVILDTAMKANLIEDIDGFFNNQELYTKLSVPWKRGLILHGVPGNGKTISIKAAINTLSSRSDPVPSLYVKSFDDNCHGAKYAIRMLFAHARVMAPCLLIFEDLDSLVTDKTRSYFLNEVDGLESNNGILMIGSTNHLDSLDPAISKRPSRFDRKYHFQLPAEEERAAYCRFWRDKLADNDMIDFHDDICPIIAKMTEGFSFAYLKELFVSALLTIARGGTGQEDEGVVDQHRAQKEDTTGSTTGDDTVVVEKRDGAGDASEGGEKITGKGATSHDRSHEEVSQKKRTLPEVEIPSTLQDNVLLKVIRNEIRMLLSEMDNTKVQVAKIAGGGLPGRDISSNVISRSFPRMMRTRMM
jgi:transitional endoplasmic reticulum ATPase